MRSLITAMGCVLVLGAGPVATPGTAHGTANASAVTAVDLAAGMRTLVRRIAGKDPRAAVRADAWVAWADESGDAAIVDFLNGGLARAEERAREASELNADFARQVLAVYTKEFAPMVHAAAQYAVTGSDSDREYFARQGFADAEQRDRQAREADGSQARALAEADRRFVRDLKDNDPGPQVRSAAAWAVRPGASDEDLVEFFAYGWAHAAALDLTAHRLRDTDNEAGWQARARRLLTDAQEAERAALDAAGEARAAARAAAARAWGAVRTQTGPARTAWAEAGQVAERQAANWRAIAAAAAAATGPNWRAIAAVADGTGTEWTAERAWAAEQARLWDDLLAQALDGETRMTDPPS
ncbi:hypothetical protein [Amycolatopsis samaneae]|uniref:Uncharacterized protein n=1 Tax=Amycolatopsis samaneae TaxID=664691 RepID=A0ABW5G917_9PSEU